MQAVTRGRRDRITAAKVRADNARFLRAVLCVQMGIIRYREKAVGEEIVVGRQTKVCSHRYWTHR
jgi:hypothetical protein